MAMSKKQIVSRLNEITSLINGLDANLKEEYGDQANIFFEADGTFHAMDGDDYSDRGSTRDRQKHIIASSSTYCQLGAGAW